MAKVIARQTFTQAPPKTANAIIPATDAPPAIIGSTASDAIGLGRYLDGERGMVGGKLRYGGALPVVVFGVNGSGKGTRLLMPNLLQSSGSSIVVVDPKGELAAVTAPHRRTLGRVVILNPFGVLTDIRGCEHLKSEGYNPLVSLDPHADDFNSQAALLAEAMAPLTSKETYWDLSARTLLAEVGIPSPVAAMRKFPHELSGGMRQRVMIAMAMSLVPKLIIADEPTTALDPTIQAQVLDLLGRLVTDSGSALILITHDFGVIAEMTDEVMVMYAGRIVEKTETAALFAAPQHPYTQSLIHSLPRIDTKVEQLTPIEGSPPALDQRIPGCAFAPRCNRRLPICTTVEPDLAASAWSATHWTACHNIQTLQQPPTQIGPER